MEQKYRQFEIFSDYCYYDMIAVRPEGERRFNFTHHVKTLELARYHVDDFFDRYLKQFPDTTGEKCRTIYSEKFLDEVRSIEQKVISK